MGGEKYSIPDQTSAVYNVNVDAVCKAEYFASEEQVEQSVAKGLSQGFPQSSPYREGMFSECSTNLFFREQKSVAEALTASTNQRVKVVTVSLTDGLNRTQDFVDSVRSLPNIFNSSSCSSFKSFISKYGTHYVQEVVYGGVISMSSSFSPQMLQYGGGSKVVSDLELQFNLLTYSGVLSSEEQKTLDRLNEEYASAIFLEGGSSDFEANQWTQWVDTVGSNAVPISLDLRLVSSIVPSQYSDRIPAINNAITAYLSALRPVIPSHSRSARYNLSPSLPFIGGTGGILQMGTPIPQSNVDFGTGIINHNLYVVGGRGRERERERDGDGQFSSNCFRINLTDGTWTSMEPLPIISGLSNMGHAVLNKTLYLIAGLDQTGPTNKVVAYDSMQNIWLQRASYPFPDWNIAAVTVGSSIYCFGGSSEFVQTYDSITDRWSQKGLIPTLRRSPQAVVVNGIVYIMGGLRQSDGEIFSLVESYNPVNEKWENRAPIPYPTMIGIASISNGKIYYFGDFDHVQMYDPQTDDWILGGSMGVYGEWQKAISLSDSTIFLIGGRRKRKRRWNLFRRYIHLRSQ